jgi:hypothetical protein
MRNEGKEHAQKFELRHLKDEVYLDVLEWYACYCNVLGRWKTILCHLKLCVPFFLDLTQNFKCLYVTRSKGCTFACIKCSRKGLNFSFDMGPPLWMSGNPSNTDTAALGLYVSSEACFTGKSEHTACHVMFIRVGPHGLSLQVRC